MAELAELLQRRYGGQPVPPLEVTDTILGQLAHRSVRRFASRPVGDEAVAAMIAAASSASTSSNMQWWSLVVVRDPERKERIRQLSGGQRFVAAAPVFLVWLADTSRSYTIAEAADTPTAGADYLETTLAAAIDATLAAQNAAVAAESLGLGITYVGGCRNNPHELAELLGLPPHVFAVFGMAVGYPDPTERAGIRPRLAQSVVVHEETYQPHGLTELEPTDAALLSYFEGFGKHHDWFSAVRGRFAGPESLHGRDRLAARLHDQGFSTR